MCKEMPVIRVDRMVDKKRIHNWKKWRAKEEGEAQGVADPPPPYKQKKQKLVSKNERFTEFQTADRFLDRKF
jgi:hypothetical protein